LLFYCSTGKDTVSLFPLDLFGHIIALNGGNKDEIRGFDTIKRYDK